MILFTKNDFIYISVTRMGEKLRKRKGNNWKLRKKISVGLLSYPPFSDLEADCFPVSENTENKPDLP